MTPDRSDLYRFALIIIRDFLVFASVWAKLWLFSGVFSWFVLLLLYLIKLDTYLVSTNETVLHVGLLSWLIIIYWLISSLVVLTGLITLKKFSTSIHMRSLNIGVWLCTIGLLLGAIFPFVLIINSGKISINNESFLTYIVILSATIGFLGSEIISYGFWVIGKQENKHRLRIGGILLPLIPPLGLYLISKDIKELNKNTKTLIENIDRLQELLLIPSKSTTEQTRTPAPKFLIRTISEAKQKFY